MLIHIKKHCSLKYQNTSISYFSGVFFFLVFEKLFNVRQYFGTDSLLEKAVWKPDSLKNTVRIIQFYCPLQIHRIVGVKKPRQ